ncbi:hypothetical protein QBC40DRAFT_326163 [Triangularia verruculosa]|uniref:Uncharacterized protein n=1 Tax=Triangularia verruculosa TaxID=2587418 RepID=A0AAN7AW99_9PEZI|nr:hypothetical protein QBC40DRAFT_326163 [Triangularia verruculosa]
MNWADIQDPWLSTDGWDYDYPTSDKNNQSRVIYAEKQTTPATSDVYQVKGPVLLPNSEEWTTGTVPWLMSPCLQTNLMDPPSQTPAARDVSGFHMFLPSQPSPSELNGKKFATIHYSLPVSETNWKTITQRFYLHRAIAQAMQNDRCSTNFQENTLVNDHTVRWFSGMTGPRDLSHSVSMSSAYFPKYRVSLAVIYNCDEAQVKEIEELVTNSPEASSHSLLMVGIFAELQANRILGAVIDSNRELDDITEKLQKKTEKGEPAKFGYEENEKLRNALLTAKRCEESA